MAVLFKIVKILNNVYKEINWKNVKKNNLLKQTTRYNIENN